MPSVGGRTAHVVDRSRRFGDEAGEMLDHGVSKSRPRRPRRRSRRDAPRGTPRQRGPATAPVRRSRSRCQRAPISGWRARANEQMAMTMALRDAHLARTSAGRSPPATHTAAISSSWREHAALRADEVVGDGDGPARRAARRARPRRDRRAVAGDSRRRGTPSRGCRRSCRGCGSAGNRRCGRRWRGRGGRLRGQR